MMSLRPEVTYWRNLSIFCKKVSVILEFLEENPGSTETSFTAHGIYALGGIANML